MRPNGRFAFWSVWAVFAFGFLLCRWTLFDSVFYNVDEAEYAVAAQALSHHMLPGLDLVGSTKPPGIVFFYKAIFAVAGESVLALQVVGIVLWLLLLALTMKLSERLFPDIPLWMTALSFFLLANSFGPPRDFQALNVELPGIVLVIGSFLFVTGERSARRVILAGVFFGLAVMFRQSLALFLFPMWMLFRPANRNEYVRIGAGIAAPWVLLTIVYAAHGGLSWAYDSWVRFPMLYAGDTGLFGFFEAARYSTRSVFLQAFVPFTLTALGIGFAIKQRSVVVLVLAVCAVLAVASGSRFFEHYYIQAFPAFALLGAIAIWELKQISTLLNRLTGVFLAVGAIMALLHFPFWRYWDPSAPPRGISMESLDLNGLEIELAEFATQQSTPDERIYVWGYCPQIYFHSKRLPAARDYLCEYVTGFSPFSSSPRQYARPDAMQMLLDDLSRNRPAVIFDLSADEYYEYSFANYPITNYPPLADYIKANYRPAAVVEQVAVYTRAN